MGMGKSAVLLPLVASLHLHPERSADDPKREVITPKPISPTFDYTKATPQCRFLASRRPPRRLLGAVPWGRLVGGGTCGRAHTIRVLRLRGVV